MDNSDLKYIKKHYGEHFAKLCRECFPTILEYPGMLTDIISNKFDEVSSLYNDILPNKDAFRTYILNVFASRIKQNQGIETEKTPQQLLEDAGYILYPECKTEQDIQSYFKYYAYGEELCTFLGGRLNTCRVWFAIKKDVAKIKRENFTNPQRQDEYGTSVISIQFTKGNSCTLSIKNRYNHKVANPDATFGNNLDNIVPGLTDAFKKEFNLNVDISSNKDFFIDGYVTASNGKIFKKILKIDNMIFCENNYIIYDNGEIENFDKAQYLLVENYLFDFSKKTIFKMDVPRSNDSFLNSIGTIKDMKVTVDKDKRKVIIITPKIGENITIVVDRANHFVEYHNSNVKGIGNEFLMHNSRMEVFDVPNVENIGNFCLYRNIPLKTLCAKNVKHIGSQFLEFNESLTEIDLPELNMVENDFIAFNKSISQVNLPKLQYIGSRFLKDNDSLKVVFLPSAKLIGYNFLFNNKTIKELYLPNAEIIMSSCLCYNNSLEKLNIANVKEIGDYCFEQNQTLTSLYMPYIEKIGSCFFSKSNSLRNVTIKRNACLGSRTSLNEPNCAITYVDSQKGPSKEL